MGNRGATRANLESLIPSVVASLPPRLTRPELACQGSRRAVGRMSPCVTTGFPRCADFSTAYPTNKILDGSRDPQMRGCRPGEASDHEGWLDQQRDLDRAPPIALLSLAERDVD